MFFDWQISDEYGESWEAIALLSMRAAACNSAMCYLAPVMLYAEWHRLKSMPEND